MARELEREVHIWCVELAASVDLFERALTLFPSSERERAARFRFPQPRNTFVLSRGVLRCLLSRYLSLPPGRVAFAYAAKGKPSLADPSSGLRFNVSHSGDMAAFAFTIGCDIGIDVEQIRAVPDLEQIAKHFFSEEECRDLALAGPACLQTAFFNCWVRKESYIKAGGAGLSIPLDSFRVSLLPSQPAALLSTSEGQADAWAMFDFRPAAGYAGAIAFRDSNRTVRLHPRTRADEMLRP